MATVASDHRHHAFWVRIVEDLALVFACAAIAWVGFVGLVRRPTSWREAVSGAALIVSPPAVEPLPLVAASRPMLAAVAAATALEERGVFGAEAAAAWQKALDECHRLAVQSIAGPHGEPLHLWLLEAERERAEEIALLISAASTTPEQAAALTELRDDARVSADQIQRYRDIVNFDHWKAVCEAGVSADGLAAREAGWMAMRADDAGRLGEAKDAIRELGLDAGLLNLMSPDRQLSAFADAFERIANQGDKIPLAQDAIKAWASSANSTGVNVRPLAVAHCCARK
jgi:hypothetical protein